MITIRGAVQLGVALRIAGLAVLLAACAGPPPRGPQVTLSASPLTLPPGGGVVTVTFSASNADSITLNGDPVGSVLAGGTLRVFVPATSRLEAKAARDGQPGATAWATVNVAPGAAPLHRWLVTAGSEGVRLLDLDHGLQPLRSWPLPGLVAGVRGLAFDPNAGRLFVTYWDVFKSGTGQVVAFDLNGRTLWRRVMTPSIDQPGLSPDGTRLYVPCGEEWTTCDYWTVLDATTGLPTADPLLHVHSGAHNTIISPDGRSAYLAALGWNYLAVVDLSTGAQHLVGPLVGNIRPFAVNAAQTLAVINSDNFSGFQVADLASGKVLFAVSPPGFPVITFPALPETQSHGVAFSPDEREIWVTDAQYKALQVFDATGLPGRAPTLLATVPLSNAPKWVNFSLDGALVFSSNGQVIDARDRKVVGSFTPTRLFLEVDEAHDGALRTNTRYGNGRRDIGQPATPAAPGSVRLNGGTITWAAAAGATNYEVWRGPAGGLHGRILATTGLSAPAPALLPGETFIVTALNAAGASAGTAASAAGP